MPDQPNHPGVYVEEVPSGSHVINMLPSSNTAFVGELELGPLNKAVMITSIRDFEAMFGRVTSAHPTSCGIHQFFLNGGTAAWVVRTQASQLAKSLRALDTVDPGDVNLLCMPDIAQLTIDEWTPVFHAAKGYCERRLAFFIADPPTSVLPNGKRSPDIGRAARRWFLNEVSNQTSHAALYFPRLFMFDPTGGEPFETECSGTLAGVYARTDATRGVWKAPAGLEATLQGIESLTADLSSDQSDQLDQVGVNSIRTLPQTGIVSWGARTVAGGGEWKYVPVRRLALHIEGSLRQGAQWAVFEPNGEALWASLRVSVGAFMSGLFKRGAFQGTTASEAFVIRCDESTMTQTDQDQGRVNILVGFAPLKPAEFVMLRITLQLAA